MIGISVAAKKNGKYYWKNIILEVVTNFHFKINLYGNDVYELDVNNEIVKDENGNPL